MPETMSPESYSRMEGAVRHAPLTRLWFCTLLGLSAACAPLQIPIQPDDIAGHVTHLRGGSLALEHDDNTIIVTPDDDVRLALQLDRDCTLWEVFADDCDAQMVAPLERVEVGDSALVVFVQDSEILNTYREEPVQMSEIESVAILVGDYAADDWEADWGFGFMIAGAAGFAAFDFQWFTTEWLVLEIGAFAAPHTGSAYTGLRLRPVQWGPVRPYAGFAVNVIIASGTTAEGEIDTYVQGGYGPRLGLDFEPGRGRWLIGIEADLFRRIDDSEPYIAGIDRDWTPFGGVRFAGLF